MDNLIATLADRYPVAIRGIMADFLESLRKAGKADGSISNYSRRILQVIVHSDIEATPEGLYSITAEKVRAARSNVISAEGWKPNTWNNTISALRNLVRFLAKRDGALVNRDALRACVLSLDGRQKKTIDPETAQSAMDASIVNNQGSVIYPDKVDINWIDLRDIAIVSFLATVGATIGEICQLKRGQADDIKNGTIALPGAGFVKPRTVSVPAPVSEMISAYLAACPHHLLSMEPLFVGTYRGKLTKRVVQLRLDKAAKSAGLAASIAPRDLRTGAIVEEMMAGTAFADLMRQFGVGTVQPIIAAYSDPAGERSLCVRAPNRASNSEEDDLLRRFQSSLIGTTKLSLATTALYATDVRQFLATIRDGGLEAVTSETIENHLAKMGTTHRPSSVLRSHAALSRFADWLVSELILDNDPMRGLVSVPSHEKVLPEFIEPDEVDVILRTLDVQQGDPEASRAALYVSLCGIDGIESSEACMLTRDDLENASKFCSETRLRADRVLRMRPLSSNAPVLVLRGMSKPPSRQAMGRTLYATLARFGLPMTSPRKLRASAIIRRLRTDNNLKSVAIFARLQDANGLVPYMAAAGMLNTDIEEALR